MTTDKYVFSINQIAEFFFFYWKKQRFLWKINLSKENELWRTSKTRACSWFADDLVCAKAPSVFFSRLDEVATVTEDEKARFDAGEERLRSHLEFQIVHFRYCFPFGRPPGFLRATLSLLERVSAVSYVPTKCWDVTVLLSKHLPACVLCLSESEQRCAWCNYSNECRCTVMLHGKSTPQFLSLENSNGGWTTLLLRGRSSHPILRKRARKPWCSPWSWIACSRRPWSITPECRNTRKSTVSFYLAS